MQIFVKLLQIIHKLILSYQKLSHLRWYNQEDFLVDSLVHYQQHDYIIKKVIKPLAKSILIPLGLNAAASAADAGIPKTS